MYSGQVIINYYITYYINSYSVTYYTNSYKTCYYITLLYNFHLIDKDTEFLIGL